MWVTEATKTASRLNRRPKAVIEIWYSVGVHHLPSLLPSTFLLENDVKRFAAGTWQASREAN